MNQTQLATVRGWLETADLDTIATAIEILDPKRLELLGFAVDAIELRRAFDFHRLARCVDGCAFCTREIA